MATTQDARRNGVPVSSVRNFTSLLPAVCVVQWSRAEYCPLSTEAHMKPWEVMSPGLSEAQCNLLRVLSQHGVRFLVIGGYAVRAHGVDRPTHDIDLWVSCSRQNAKKAGRALGPFGSTPAARWEEIISTPNKRLAYPNEGPDHQGDLLTSVGNLDFDAVYQRSVEIVLCDRRFRMPNRDDLIAIKKVSAESGNDESKKAQDIRYPSLEQVNAPVRGIEPRGSAAG
jgi:hypothetical protein